MGKCLITKLNGTVDNVSLPYLGEIRIQVQPVDNPTTDTQVIGIHLDKAAKAKIVGDGYFTNSTLSSNDGKTKELISGRNDLFVSNGNFYVCILGKYDLTTIRFHRIDTMSYPSHKGFNIEGLSYSKKIQVIEMSMSPNIIGDVSALANLTELTKISLSETKVSGDVASFKKLTKLTSLNIQNTKNVSGDISAFAGLTNLDFLGSYFISGNIENLKNLSKLRKVAFYFSDNLTGDLSKLPASVNSFNLLYSIYSTLTWSSRPASANIIAIDSNATLQNVDKMLQDQAACTDALTISSDKKIRIKGARTSASDAAVQTLQSKGYTVSITPA